MTVDEVFEQVMSDRIFLKRRGRDYGPAGRAAVCSLIYPDFI